MMHQGELVGVLNVTKAAGKQPFEQGDVELLTVLAQQAAAAIRVARLLKETQEAYEQLQNLDRLRADLVDILAHEMRTPVTVLKGYMEIMPELSAEERERALGAVRRHLQRLEVLVRELFRLSTLRVLERQPSPRPVSIPQ